MSTTTELPRLLLPTEVAEALRVSRRTVARMIARGDLPAVRIGPPRSSVRVPLDAVAELIQQSTKEC